MPADRFDVKSHCDPSGKTKNTSLTPYGCFVDHPDQFDTHLFNMSPREAAQTDPIHRILLMTVYEALEMSGYSFNRTAATDHRKIGTFFGQTSDDWREVNAAQNIDIYHITGGIRAFGPGRVNYHFNWEGPSFSIDTACSASLAAIHLACSSLRSGECDTAVSGGGNIISASDMFAGLSRGGFLSPTGSCKTWDSDADGYCRADGVGIVILKRLEDAILDHDNIHAVIKGISTNHSAKAISITHPHRETQERLLKKVLQEARLSPRDIDYVEMHGTGTQAGDIAESTAIANVFADGQTRDKPLFIGTVKPNLGHGEAASGVTSVIKAVMMFRKSMIPPHVGIKHRINGRLPPFPELNIEIPMEKTPFIAKSSKDSRRKILVNNFNATGGNTSLILEDSPKRLLKGKDPRSSHIVVVSAQSFDSFRQNLERLAIHLQAADEIKLADLSYTTTARRMHHSIRRAYVSSSTLELLKQIEEDLRITVQPSKTIGSPSFVFAFSGQGSQYLGMGKQLFESSSTFREKILDLNTICHSLGLPCFLKGLMGEDWDPVQSQLALVAVEVSLAFLWQSWGIKPNLVIGHSLGEYAALCVSGVLSITDMLFLVGKRASLLQAMCEMGSYGMLAIGLSKESLQGIIMDLQFQSCEIACLNGPTSNVVSGTAQDIEKLNSHLRALNIQASRLQVPYAFHSPQVDPILGDYEEIARQVHFGKPQIPFFSTLLGATVVSEDVVCANYLVRQTREPVDFLNALKRCQELEVIGANSIWTEIGPGRTSLAMVQSTLDVCSDHLQQSIGREEENWKTISASLATAYNSGANVNWSEFHREYEDALTLLDLPTYAFDLKSHWIPYEGDWALRKGSNSTGLISPLPHASLHSTTIHRVESESFTEDRISVVFVTDLIEPALRKLIFGHLVNNHGLCPSSVYADMALVAACYIWSRVKLNDQPLTMEVSELIISKPLIIQPDSARQLVRITVLGDRRSEHLRLTFTAHDQVENVKYAHCSVSFGDGKDWKSKWAEQAYLFRARIDHLTSSPNVHRVMRNMVYKIFSGFVKYDREYQGLEEVYLDSEQLEATARVTFQASATSGTFKCNPCWIDSLAQLSGFVLNGSDTTSENTVYISHGWESMQITSSLSKAKSYQTYVRMQSSGSQDMMSGSVYVFEEESIIAVFNRVKFRSMKRTVLHQLLESTSQPSKEVLEYSNNTAPVFPSTDYPVVSQTDDSLVDTLISLIVSETGVDPTELMDDAKMADLGVDSLLTITLLAKIKEKTHLSVPASLFTDFPTIKGLKQYFRGCPSIQGTAMLSDRHQDTSSKVSSSFPTISTPKSRATSTPTCNFTDAFEKYKGNTLTLPRCNSVHLQGFNSNQLQPILFLLPDGSGSASSYISLPTFSSNLQIIGLDSPFLESPQDYTQPLKAFVQYFVSAILERQPKGAYLIGGWSIGGIYAYEVAVALIAMRQVVQGLVLIDAPDVQAIPPMTPETIDLLEHVGIFDDMDKNEKHLPPVVRRHFLASIEALKHYIPTYLDRSSDALSHCLLIWARQGLLDSLDKSQQSKAEDAWHIDGPTTHNWLMYPRENYKGSGWENLVGRLEYEVIDGNHFSIMKQPAVSS